MARSDSEILDGVKSLIDESETYLEIPRQKWEMIYDQVFNGTPTGDLEDWQAKFTLPVLMNAILAARTELVETLINRSDWYDLDELNPNDFQAREIKDTLKKILDYYLRVGNFKTVASDCIMNSLIAVANVAVLWQDRRIQNPAWLEWKDRQTDPSPEEAIAQYNAISPEDLANEIQSMGSLLESAITGESFREDIEPEKEIIVGGIKLDMPHFSRVWWEPSAPTINESPWQAYEFCVPDYQLQEYADAKVFKKKAVRDLLKTDGNREIRIIAYFGPRISTEDGQRRIKEKNFYCYYSGDIVLASGAYPYIEVREQSHPLVNGVARRMPYVNYGMSPSEFSVEMQRWLDHNWRLLTDQMRFGVLGFNVVNHGMLVNKDILDHGLEPGVTLRVNGNPRDAFQHLELTSNRENQAHPVNELLRNGVTEAVGTGGPGFAAVNLRSRTTSREVDALQQRSERSLVAIANEISESFIIPLLEKCFARVIQFGLAEVETNPELSAILDTQEKELIKNLGQQDRMRILRTFYRFKLRGYKAREEDAAILEALNALLQATSQNPQFQAKINYEALLEEYTERLDLSDKSLVVTQPSEYDTIAYENGLLAQGKAVQVSPNDNHELHLQMQAPGPESTPAAQQHYQQHVQYYQQAQSAQRQPGENMV